MMLNRILYHISLSNWLLKGVSNPIHFDISPKLKSCFSCHVKHTDSACIKYLLQFREKSQWIIVAFDGPILNDI